MVYSDLKSRLQNYLQRVTGPVELVAAGDATTVPYKQIIIAMGEGAKAALGAFDRPSRAPLPQAAARATIAA
jgi:alkyl hydroperoxide reductase subunit F